MAVVEVVVTSPLEWMQPFVDAVVEERLVACVHQVVIDATYRWEGEVERGREARAMMHTSTDRLPDLVSRIRADHLFDVPCILTIPVHAEDDYASWVEESTRRE